MLPILLLLTGCFSYAWLHEHAWGQASCSVCITVPKAPMLPASVWHQRSHAPLHKGGTRGASHVGVHGVLQLRDVLPEQMFCLRLQAADVPRPCQGGGTLF